ncbi:uncharacterized protein LOC130428465 [Triplophysa dalaica]|uniref:uncharacterized protein LOC130428465 n=1 Tax=Triplophysa dalaica TaxID=1582913 RepID=UPI0024E01D90|nr:uncharacterized protein LOC130428465 [Triplophysa dalaica]
MYAGVITKLFILPGILFHFETLLTVQAETHSLYYIYTALSKPVNLPGIYEFTAMGLLDGIQIDYYNSMDQKKIPKQQWIKEKMPADYWEKGTRSRKSKQQWFNVNINIVMERMRHNNSDLHVLQWRHGCEIEEQERIVTFFKGISEYAYDGEDFFSFDNKVSQWIAPVDAAVPSKVKWDNVPILNQYTKGYLEKECVDWINRFREYKKEERKNTSPPKVHVFARKSCSDKNKWTLTCLATGFNPKDVTLIIRKNLITLPETEIESTGVRPNYDGTYQIRKSVEIVENEKHYYDCFVTHTTLKEAITVKWDQEIASTFKCENVNVRPKLEEFGRGYQVPAQSETHSLYYIYTALSKPVNLPGIYQFTAMGLLDGIQIDYYNNKDQKKIPKQQWMKEKMPADYWEKGTQSRKSKEQWFNVNVNIVMERMRHNNSDIHVLQWRHGCEIEEQESTVTFSKGISEYAYDGEDFFSFDNKVSQWVAPVDAAVPTKVKWDNVPILNQYTKGYLEKKCVDWLNRFREYKDEKLKNTSPPNVHVFARKSCSDKNKWTLTCLATGFNPKDVTLIIRKNLITLPETEIESTGVRPNYDGTYQIRKSVEIVENEKHYYDCFVTHTTLKEAITVKWDQEIASTFKCENVNVRPKLEEFGRGYQVPAQSESHSLYYIYTALSKPLPGISQFTAMGLLDGKQIDYYDSIAQKKIPKQQWMKDEMPADYWEKGTQSRKSKEQWFNVNINILMERMNHIETDLHVFQWRHGCEIEKQENEFKFSKGISEYAYDGEDFLSFDTEVSQWVALTDPAVKTKTKWDNVPILNQYTKGYLEKECVDWLNKFREYGIVSPPEVYVFTRGHRSDKNKLKFCCLATGFYPKDVTLIIRKNQKPLPETEIESTGVRPNHDGTYQIQKCVEIVENEKADYDCFVTRKTVREGIVIK